MKYKYSLLGLAAGTALLVAAGCGKQEPAATQSSDNANKAAAPAKPQVAEAAKPADTQPATSADKSAGMASQPDTAANSTPAPVRPPPAALTPPPALASATNTAVNQPATAALNAAVVSNAVASVLSSNTASVSAAQSAATAQQMSFSQNLTNQLRALAAAATNQALSTLGTTNLSASTATNQVQALLERARTLCANQKYQDALSNITQLYTYKLTPEQKQKADDLASQIKTGIAQKATSTLSGFLGGGSK